MQLRLSEHCITVDLYEHSSHFLHVSQTLSKHFSKSFWINKTLINLPTQKEKAKRKEFLTSLYYTCAFNSQTENLDFLQRLIALHDKPIKVVLRNNNTASHKPYYLSPLAKCYALLEATQEESLESIRKKYLRLVKQYHPDSTATSKTVGMFQKIQEAYETIKNEKHKKCAA
ncbi:MAG: J domain-containing protein [Sulfurospirillaceae bacterium]|nr:J domain-containing protein [Sulfurospirillaceae bacterium]MDD2827140.1 J domain-containing protein [Sulfurospirillaceae bacterium]